MNTPVVDFVRRYAQQRTARMHMPGHKGRGPLGCEELDITEIAGADELYEAERIHRKPADQFLNNERFGFLFFKVIFN